MECFSIFVDEIRGRLDVESNYKKISASEDFLKLKNHKIKKINDIAQLRRGPFGGSIKKEIFIEDTPDSYQVYEQYNAINNDVKRARYFISEQDFHRLKSFSVQKNDILMSCSGTIGRLTTIPDNFRRGVINQALLRIRLNPDIDLKYFMVIFNYIIEKLISGNEFAYGSAIRNVVSVKELKEINIPFPDKSIQNKIVQLMDEAYLQKKEKEGEARKLVDSIDDYVLDELGIKLPELEDRMTYVVYADNVLGKRIDAYYYQPKFKEIEKALKRGKFDLIKIGDKFDLLNQLEKFKDISEISYVDLSSIDKNSGCVTKAKNMMVKEAPSRAKQKIEKGDLLVSSLGGSLKSISVYDREDENSVASTGFHIIKDSGMYNNYYLFALFRTSLFQNLIQRETTGAIMSAINKDSFKQIKIPLPPLSVQNKIADEVKRKMQKAEQLQKEAKEELEKAKLEVEKIILGN